MIQLRETIRKKLKILDSKRVIYGLYIFLLLFTAYHVYYAKRIIPGVHVGGVDLGGMHFSEAKALLLEYEQNASKTMTLKYGEESFTYPGSSYELVYNVEATAVRAFEVGRTGNPFVDTKEKLVGLIKPLKIPAFYDLNSDKLSNVFSIVRGEIDESYGDAYYEFDEEGSVVVVSSTIGKKVKGDKLYAQFVKGLDEMEFSTIEIEVEPVQPKIVDEDLAKHLTSVKELVSEPFYLEFEEQSFEISDEELLSFITVSTKDGASGLKLNNRTFEAYMELLAQDIDQLPRGQVTELRDNLVAKFEIIQDGRELHVRDSTEAFKDAFFAGEHSSELVVNLVTELDDTSVYGIKALLGEGHSKFTGSAASRVHNLTLAAERTNGILVAPGETYSFNNSVGEISAATGYSSAWVISDGRTVLGDGGGVCQTSTTLFRAILDAGLPVVTRHPHAYRVIYYELESPVGIDASIYQPSLDLQFANDTENYILIQTAWDKDSASLVFKLYGTPDGREVEMTEPIVTNQAPPPEALYQDDPSLPKGTVKQIDFAAWGATTSFDRVVKRDGEILHEDTFVTNYQPWRAVYLVGTKES